MRRFSKEDDDEMMGECKKKQREREHATTPPYTLPYSQINVNIQVINRKVSLYREPHTPHKDIYTHSSFYHSGTFSPMKLFLFS